MPPSKTNISQLPDPPGSVLREDDIESLFINRLKGLKYDYRSDSINRAMKKVFWQSV